MTPSREHQIQNDIDRIECPEFFAGYVSGLRNQGELRGSVPMAIVQKLKSTGWRNYEPFPEFVVPMNSAAES
jgi:hypothetical protein